MIKFICKNCDAEFTYEKDTDGQEFSKQIFRHIMDKHVTSPDELFRLFRRIFEEYYIIQEK